MAATVDSIMYMINKILNVTALCSYGVLVLFSGAKATSSAKSME